MDELTELSEKPSEVKENRCWSYAGGTALIVFLTASFAVLLAPETACYPDKMGEALRVGFGFLVTYGWVPILIATYLACRQQENDEDEA